MPNRLYKILIILTILAVFAAIPIFWSIYKAPLELKIDFFDVGQGDSTLIKTPYGQNILIDGGPDSAVIKRLGESLPWWDKKIDLMVLSHPHDDHITGLIEVIKRYRVKKILYTGALHSAPNYLAWLELVRDKKIPVVIVDRPQAIRLGNDCRLEILYPKENLAGKTSANLNNSSIVAKLVYKNKKFLFPGDIEEEIEKELAESGTDLKADVLKVGHQGSTTSTSEIFLEKVMPDFAVIEVGASNSFGHPSKRILSRLERMGAKIFRTDLDGTIKLTADGEVITID